MSAMPFLLSSEWKYHKCCKCGVEFASPILLDRLSDKRNFFCPNGHIQHYLGESNAAKADRLYKEVINERSRADKAESRVNQFTNGRCPCCKQKFRRLKEHMHREHPKFPK